MPQMGFAQEQADPAAIEQEPEPPIRSNHFVPIFDIVAFDSLLNRYGYRFVDRAAYDVDGASIRRNVRAAWVVDNDPFDINQFMHPYQGAMYHGFARSAGLSYWEAMGYTFAGSGLWELAGETTAPSKNDQIASGIGGSFLGEPLFRLAELVLRPSDHRFLRELSALIVSPSTGFNRLVYGNRFKGIEPSYDPALFETTMGSSRRPRSTAPTRSRGQTRVSSRSTPSRSSSSGPTTGQGSTVPTSAARSDCRTATR